MKAEKELKDTKDKWDDLVFTDPLVSLELREISVLMDHQDKLDPK